MIKKQDLDRTRSSRFRLEEASGSQRRSAQWKRCGRSPGRRSFHAALRWCRLDLRQQRAQRRSTTDSLRATGITNPQFAISGSDTDPAATPRNGPTIRTPSRPDDPRFPYVLSTYRLTEHHTAGGMSRTVPHLSELQPELVLRNLSGTCYGARHRSTASGSPSRLRAESYRRALL